MKKLLTTGLLCTMMGLSMMPVHAKAATTDAAITKTFNIPEGVTAIDQTFHFSATPTNGGPQASIGELNFKELGTLKNGSYSLSKKADITFGNFPHAGVYTYNVKENKGEDARVTYSNETYLMRVYVINSDEGLKVKQITAEKDNKKCDQMSFINSYATKSDLTISKMVEGDYGDQSKDFSFTIAFTKGTLGADTITTVDGKTIKSGEDYTFTLKHGEHLTFKDLPVGTKYQVKENDHEGYKAEVSVNNQALKEADTTGDQVVNDQKNTVAFTNTENEIVVTGVMMKSLPYIALIALGIIGFAGLFFMRRRKMQH